jgi:hypothetical protein
LPGVAEVELGTGINPDDPDELVLAVVIDPEASDGERALMALGDLCYPDDETGVYYISATDAYADRRIADGEVTVDIVSFPAVLENVGVTAEFPAHDAESVRLLRVTGETEHGTLPAATLVFTTPLEELTDNEDQRPFVLAPPPDQRSVAENVRP